MATGMDTALFLKSSLPKTFFYGTYQFRLSYISKKKEVYACIILVVEIKRPWETD